MDSFKSRLDENSFYTVQKEKDEFVNNDKFVINAFFFSFIMSLGFLDSAKNNDKVKLYFRGDKKLKIDNINDDNNDTSLIIKIMADKGFFKTPQTTNEITRFLVKLKSGQVPSVDPVILRGWIEQIKPDKLVGSSSVIKKLTKEFMDGGSLASFADSLKANAKVTRWKQLEFYDTAKTLKIDPAKKKAAPAGTTSAQKVEPSAAAATPVVDTPVVSAPAVTATRQATTKVQKPAKPAGKVAWADTDVMVTEFARGTDIDSSYKHTAKNREDFLQAIVKRYKDGLLNDSQVNPMIEFLKKFPMTQKKVQEAILGNISSVLRYPYQTRVSDDVLVVVKSNFFELLEKAAATKAVKKYLKAVVSNIFRGLSKLESPKAMEDYKISYSKFFNSSIVQNNRSDLEPYRFTHIHSEKIFNAFMFSKSDQEFLEALVTKGIILKTSAGKYTYDFRRSKEENLASLELLKTKGVQQSSQLEVTINAILKNTELPWNVVPDDKEEFYGWLNSLSKSEYDKVAVKGLLSADNITAPWHEQLIRDFVEKISPEVLLINSVGKGNIYNRIDIKDDLKQDAGMAATKKLLDYLANNSLSKIDGIESTGGYARQGEYSVAIDNLYDLASHYKLLSNSAYKSTLAKIFMEGLENILILRERNKYYSSSGNIFTRPGQPNVYRDNILTDKQIEELDLKLIQHSEITGFGIFGPISSYSDLSDSNKKLIQAMIKSKGPDGLRNAQLILDADFFNTLSVEDVGTLIGTPSRVVAFLPEASKKDVVLNLLKNPTFRQKVVEEYKNTFYKTSSSSYRNDAIFLDILIESEDIDVPTYNKIATSYVDKLESNKDDSGYGTTMAYINKQEKFNNKSKVLTEKLILSADSRMNKMKTEYRDFMSSAQNQFLSYVENDRKGAEFLYQSTSKSMRKRLANAYMNSTDFSTSAKVALANPSSPIKPFEALTDKRIKEILKYNNVASEETKISEKYIRDFTSMDTYLRGAAKNRKPIEDLKVEEISMTPKELTQLTVDMHRTKRNERHGREAMVIKRSFNVAIPMQAEAQKVWIEKDPNQEIVNPMYHGTGAIAASMILRYGFRVIKRGDPSVVARMLGDGVYGAIHIDKSQQYVGDNGYGRRIGGRGYIFEMNGALGKEGQDYKSAGIKDGDGIRSPEWCVFSPNAQFKIFKAHEVVIVSEGTMKNILGENPPSAPVRESTTITPGLGFKSYLKESIINQSTNYTTYTFVNGLIPMNRDEMVDFESFKSPNPSMITLEPSAYGPSVVIRGTEGTNDYLFTGPSDFKMNLPEVFEEYLDYMRKKVI